MCWQHHNKSSATVFLLQSYRSWMFTPLHCSLPFPTFGTLPGHISSSTTPSLTLWHTPLFSLFVWSCLDYWNALLVCLLTNAIKWLQLGQNRMLSPLAGTGQGGLYKFPVWSGSNAFVTTSRVSSCQLPFSFNWVPWGPSILIAPKHSPKRYQSASDSKFLFFSLKAQESEKEAHIFFSHWVRVGKLSASDFCSLLISSFHSYIVPQHKYLSIYKSVLCLNIQELQFISKSWFNGFHTFLLPTSTLLCKQNELMLGLGKLRDEDVHLEENSDAPKRSKKSYLLLACYCLGGGDGSG